MIKLSILTLELYPGLTELALNAIICNFIRGDREKFDLREKSFPSRVIMEAETGVMRPQAKEGWQPPEAGRNKEHILP